MKLRIRIVAFLLTHLGGLCSLWAQHVQVLPTSSDLCSLDIFRITATVYQNKAEEWEEASKTTYSYCDQGRLQEENHFVKDDFLVVSIQWSYDSLGNISAQHIFRPQTKKKTLIKWDRVYKDGKLIREKNNQTSLIRSFRYNSTGKLVELRSCIGKGDNISVERYAYDVKGNMIREEVRSSLMTRLMVYEYDSIGQCIKTCFTTTYRIENKPPSTEILTYKYNQKGQIVACHTHNAKGKILRTTTYMYDQSGRLIKVDCPGKNKAWIRDEAGRVVQELRWDSKKLIEKTVFSYQTTPKSTSVVARKGTP